MPALLRGSYRDGAIRVVQEADDIVAICLEGEFDLHNTPAVQEEVERALESRNDIILDLSQATFIDSSLINVLFHASQAADANGRTTVLQLGTAPLVERVLGFVGIERVLPRAHTRAQATQMIKRGAAPSGRPK